MNIFVYEWVCGGGFLDRDQTTPRSLADEGWAMLYAVLDDFVELDGTAVTTLVEEQYAARMSDEWMTTVCDSPESRNQQFDRLAAEAAATLLIAPEFEGILLGLANRVCELGGKLLSPGPDFIEIASDKQSTVERLHAAGVATPRGNVVMSGERFPPGTKYPAVLKPLDGCGSMGVARSDISDIAPSDAPAYRLEEFVPGRPISVAVLCGDARLVVLEPCEQAIEGDTFAYRGGKLPLPADLADRARALAEAAVRALPPTHGYVGVDLILGEAADGSDDVVIEINPRLTTSYVGLRAATSADLAIAMTYIAGGQPYEPPVFTQAVTWTPDGRVDRTPVH